MHIFLLTLILCYGINYCYNLSLLFLIFYVTQEFFRPVLLSKNVSLVCNWVTLLRSASLADDIETYSVTENQATVGVSMSTAKN